MLRLRFMRYAYAAANTLMITLPCHAPFSLPRFARCHDDYAMMITLRHAAFAIRYAAADAAMMAAAALIDAAAAAAALLFSRLFHASARYMLLLLGLCSHAA